jgi:ribosomal protein L11
MMGKLKINARNVMADIQKLGDKWKGIRITVLIKVKDR